MRTKPIRQQTQGKPARQLHQPRIARKTARVWTVTYNLIFQGLQTKTGRYCRKIFSRAQEILHKRQKELQEEQNQVHDLLNIVHSALDLQDQIDCSEFPQVCLKVIADKIEEEVNSLKREL